MSQNFFQLKHTQSITRTERDKSTDLGEETDSPSSTKSNYASFQLKTVEKPEIHGNRPLPMSNSALTQEAKFGVSESKGNQPTYESKSDFFSNSAEENESKENLLFQPNCAPLQETKVDDKVRKDNSLSSESDLLSTTDTKHATGSVVESSDLREENDSILPNFTSSQLNKNNEPIHDNLPLSVSDSALTQEDKYRGSVNSTCESNSDSFSNNVDETGNKENPL